MKITSETYYTAQFDDYMYMDWKDIYIEFFFLISFREEKFFTVVKLKIPP